MGTPRFPQLRRHVVPAVLASLSLVLQAALASATEYTPSAEFVVDPGTRYLDSYGWNWRVLALPHDGDVLFSWTDGTNSSDNRWIRTNAEGYALEPLIQPLGASAGTVIDLRPEITGTYAALRYNQTSGLRFARLEHSREPALAEIVLDASGPAPLAQWIVPVDSGYGIVWAADMALHYARVSDGFELVGEIVTLSADVGDAHVETGADGTIVAWVGSDGIHARALSPQGTLEPFSFHVPFTVDPETQVAAARKGDFALLVWSHGAVVRRALVRIPNGALLSQTDLPLAAGDDLAAAATGTEYIVASNAGPIGVAALRVSSSGAPVGDPIALGEQVYWSGPIGWTVTACATPTGVLVAWLNAFSVAGPGQGPASPAGRKPASSPDQEPASSQGREPRSSQVPASLTGAEPGRAQTPEPGSPFGHTDAARDEWGDCWNANWIRAREIRLDGSLGPLREASATHEPSVAIPWFVGDDLRVFTTSESGSALETVAVGPSGNVTLLHATVLSTSCWDEVAGGAGALEGDGLRVAVKERDTDPWNPGRFEILLAKFGADGLPDDPPDRFSCWWGDEDTARAWDVVVAADTVYVASSHYQWPDQRWVRICQRSIGEPYSWTSATTEIPAAVDAIHVALLGGEPRVVWAGADGFYTASARFQSDGVAEASLLLAADSAQLLALETGEAGGLVVFSGEPTVGGETQPFGVWALFLGTDGAIETGPFDLGLGTVQSATAAWTGSEYFLAWCASLSESRREYRFATLDHGADPGVLEGTWVAENFRQSNIFLAVSDQETVAMTYGDRLRFFTPETSSVPIEGTRVAASWMLVPNPSRSSLRLRIQQDVTGPVEIALIDLSGRILDRTTRPHLLAREAIDVTELVRERPSGTYWVRVQTPRGTSARAVQLVR